MGGTAKIHEIIFTMGYSYLKAATKTINRRLLMLSVKKMAKNSFN